MFTHVRGDMDLRTALRAAESEVTIGKSRGASRQREAKAGEILHWKLFSGDTIPGTQHNSGKLQEFRGHNEPGHEFSVPN